MKLSIQTSMEELKDVFFEKDELEYPDMLILKPLLPFSAHENSKSDRREKFREFKNELSASCKKLSVAA